MSEYQITCTYKNYDIRCFAGPFLLVMEEQNRYTITDWQSDITGGCPS